MITNFFYNKNLSYETNSILWWTWESIIHHIYFIVLFVQRQFSDKWSSGDLWRVNMEKECEFFKLLFGGDSVFCAEASTSIFAGLWFKTPTPNKLQLVWIGRLIANYQHSEAIIHFLICVFGLMIVYVLGSQTKTTGKISGNVPGWIRWAFFGSLFFETWTMCVPYLFLFGWAWMPFVSEGSVKDPLVNFIENLGDGDKFINGIQFGAALITMFWVSVLVLILDGWAMMKAWSFALNGRQQNLLTAVVFGGTAAFFGKLLVDFFNPESRGFQKEGISLSELVADTLHGLYTSDKTPMAALLPKK